MRHGLLADGDVPAVLARIAPTTSLVEAAAGASLVVEGIAEDLDVKRAVFAELDAYCPDGALFTSTTSYLDIFRVVPERRLPTTVIAHWFAPPHIVPLVEVVRGERTSDETVDCGGRAARAPRQDARRHGPVRARVLRQPPSPQHRARGLLPARQRLHDAGAARRRRQGQPGPARPGPRLRAALRLHRARPQPGQPGEPRLRGAPRDDAPRSLVDRVARGDLGVKSGRGFYDYSGRDLEDVLSARDDALIRAFAAAGELEREAVARR